MTDETEDVVIDWDAYEETRARLGRRFSEHFGFFRNEAPQAVTAIEVAMQNADASEMIVPANRLAEQAEIFGAELLASLAEHIQLRAQACLSHHDTPDDLLHAVIALRPCMNATLVELVKKASPVVVTKHKGAAKRMQPKAPILLVRAG